MNIGELITVREHAHAPKYQYRITKIHDGGEIVAENTKDGASNRKGGYVPRIYLTPTNIEFMEKAGWIERQTEEVVEMQTGFVLDDDDGVEAEITVY
jgi:hypothetical protein